MSKEKQNSLKRYILYCGKQHKRRLELFSQRWLGADYFHEYLVTIEPYTEILDAEMDYLIEIYFQRGKGEFRNVDHQSTDPEKQKFSELLAKYSIEEKAEKSGFQVGILELVRVHPLQIAQQLKVNNSSPVGDLSGLPKCLAFYGGIHLIPETEDWEPMSVLWKMWKGSVERMKNGDLDLVEEYVKLSYRSPSHINRKRAMENLFVQPCSASDVMQILKNTLKDFSGINRELMKDQVQFYADTLFPSYPDNVFNFYMKNRIRPAKRERRKPLASTISTKSPGKAGGERYQRSSRRTQREYYTFSGDLKVKTPEKRQVRIHQKILATPRLIAGRLLKSTDSEGDSPKDEVGSSATLTSDLKAKDKKVKTPEKKQVRIHQKISATSRLIAGKIGETTDTERDSSKDNVHQGKTKVKSQSFQSSTEQETTKCLPVIPSLPGSSGQKSYSCDVQTEAESLSTPVTPTRKTSHQGDSHAASCGSPICPEEISSATEKSSVGLIACCLSTVSGDAAESEIESVSTRKLPSIKTATQAGKESSSGVGEARGQAEILGTRDVPKYDTPNKGGTLSKARALRKQVNIDASQSSSTTTTKSETSGVKSFFKITKKTEDSSKKQTDERKTKKLSKRTQSRRLGTKFPLSKE